MRSDGVQGSLRVQRPAVRVRSGRRQELRRAGGATGSQPRSRIARRQRAPRAGWTAGCRPGMNEAGGGSPSRGAGLRPPARLPALARVAQAVGSDRGAGPPTVPLRPPRRRGGRPRVRFTPRPRAALACGGARSSRSGAAAATSAAVRRRAARDRGDAPRRGACASERIRGRRGPTRRPLGARSWRWPPRRPLRGGLDPRRARPTRDRARRSSSPRAAVQQATGAARDGDLAGAAGAGGAAARPASGRAAGRSWSAPPTRSVNVARSCESSSA